MKRQIVKIDRDLCNGCGECIPNCHEGAIQMIDDKATLVSELMCDGLGACLGHCPVGAITIEEREAEPYDEITVMKEIVSQGKNVVIAHLKHLKDHNETEYLKLGVSFLKENSSAISFDVNEVISTVHNYNKNQKTMKMHIQEENHSQCGCPGSKTMSFNNEIEQEETGSLKSQLTQWPIQLHLINPGAGYFQGADLLIAADCVAFSLGNFHQNYLKGKKLVIACPKLDDGQDVYVTKFTRLINEAKVNTITVMIMEVPCCGGLVAMIRTALSQASRKVPVKVTVVGIQGEILQDEWL